MGQGRLEIKHCILNKVTRQYGTDPISDLLGVIYYHHVSPEIEFPVRFGQMDLFVRFIIQNLTLANIRIRVLRLDSQDLSIIERLNQFRFQLNFSDGEQIRDQSFRMTNIQITGPGLYEVRIEQQRKHRWRGLVNQRLGNDYFYVVRAL